MKVVIQLHCQVEDLSSIINNTKTLTRYDCTFIGLRGVLRTVNNVTI